MAKKTRSTGSAEDGQSAESILGLVDSLPPAERTKLFELLFCHPENQPVQEHMALAEKIRKKGAELYEIVEKRSKLGALISEIEFTEKMVSELDESIEARKMAEIAMEGWNKADKQLEDSIPKRMMSKERVETAETYLRS